MGTSDATYYAVFADCNSSIDAVTWNINGVVTSASGGENVNTVLKTSSVSPESENGKWTAVAKNSYAATYSQKAQLGSGSYKFAGTITLSNSSIPSDAIITGIKLTATSTATSTNPYKITATVDGKSFGTETIHKDNPDCSWSGEAIGNNIVLTTSCNDNKNIVISSITVNYELRSYSNYSTIIDPTHIRTTSSGKYGTICLPCAASYTGAKIYSASLNNTKDAIILSEINTDMVAGEAYIYHATADEQVFTYTGETVIVPISAGPLIGVFAETPVPVGAYVMQTKNNDQQFYIVAEGKQPKLSANKAYVQVPAEAKSLRISKEDVTFINAINHITSDNAKIYDINGHELHSLQKGINIVDGVKVYVK